MRRILLIAVVAWSVAAVAPAPAAAARCGTAILKDWSDGKINGTYPVRCYQDALDRMPEDMRSYTTAPDDIRRALLARLRDARLHERSTPSGRKARATRAPSQAAPRTTRRVPRREALSSAALPASTPTGFPLPLVVLAAIGVVLLLSGSAAFLSRRLRARGEPT